MILAPITLREARRFIGEHHRHNLPPRGWLFGVALHDEAGAVAAVAIAGRPLARAAQDGTTVEILRVCTLEQRNAASRLYGALCRAAKALGYRRAISYTLASEPGTSLRAAGFQLEAQLPPRSSSGWAAEGRERYDGTVWGEPVLPGEPRLRWARAL